MAHLRRSELYLASQPSVFGVPPGLFDMEAHPALACWAKVFGVPPGLFDMELAHPALACWAKVFGVPPGLFDMGLAYPALACWAKVFGVPPGLFDMGRRLRGYGYSDGVGFDYGGAFGIGSLDADVVFAGDA